MVVHKGDCHLGPPAQQARCLALRALEGQQSTVNVQTLEAIKSGAILITGPFQPLSSSLEGSCARTWESLSRSYWQCLTASCRMPLVGKSNAAAL